MPELADALRDPIPLASNRIPRFYRGGRLLGAFRGLRDAEDDDRPEDWVGSATRAWAPHGARRTPLGLSTVAVRSRRATLEDLLAEAPEALIGRPMLARAGPTLGLLVKLLDAAERLPVHCHPTRDAASRLLDSAFGKTEAWLILGVRDEATPRVWAGFREAVDRRTLRQWIERQDSDALLDALVVHDVAPGDVLLIPAGVPHAIGGGIFLLELQEPTDFSVVAETRGFPVLPDDASLGLGWETAIDFFQTDAVEELRQAPSPTADGVINLLGAEADPYFRALRLEVTGERRLDLDPGFAVAVVLSGSGKVHGAHRGMPLGRGSTFAIPAAATAELVLASDDGMAVILCLPPRPDLAPDRPAAR